ncbi:nitrate reductase delta subunit, partial [Vibrio parahaemolyticus V-223/04]
VTSLLLRNR